MAKSKIDWRLVINVAIAVLSALAGALGESATHIVAKIV